VKINQYLIKALRAQDLFSDVLVAMCSLSIASAYALS
jgi:hypothetical protein